MNHIQNYKYSVNTVDQIMLYLMNITEKHLRINNVLIYNLEQLIEVLYISCTGHLPITLKSPTQLTHVLDQAKAALQETNTKYTFMSPVLYYYYEMKLVSFEYDKSFNLLPSISSYHLTLQIETFELTSARNSACAYQR